MKKFKLTLTANAKLRWFRDFLTIGVDMHIVSWMDKAKKKLQGESSLVMDISCVLHLCHLTNALIQETVLLRCSIPNWFFLEGVATHCLFKINCSFHWYIGGVGEREKRVLAGFGKERGGIVRNFLNEFRWSESLPQTKVAKYGR